MLVLCAVLYSPSLVLLSLSSRTHDFLFFFFNFFLLLSQIQQTKEHLFCCLEVTILFNCVYVWNVSLYTDPWLYYVLKFLWSMNKAWHSSVSWESWAVPGCWKRGSSQLMMSDSGGRMKRSSLAGTLSSHESFVQSLGDGLWPCLLWQLLWEYEVPGPFKSHPVLV